MSFGAEATWRYARAACIAAIVLAQISCSGSSRKAASASDACLLQSIPAEARVRPTHGVDYYIYPPTIPNTYDGCQIMWLEDGRKLAIARYAKGVIQSCEIHKPKGGTVVCNYVAPRAGAAAPSNADDCPTVDQFPF
jgi:hypothetical protein